jgi:hypothetical protein
MSGGKGGSQTSEVTVPQYIEDAARANLNRAGDVANIGPIRYEGPDVAAYSPMQMAAARGLSDTASAFGVAGGGMSDQDLRGGMPEPTEFAGGVRGYSSAPMYDESMAAFKERSPGQYDFINSLFVDPVTGELGSRAGSQPEAPAPQGVGLGTTNYGGSGGGGISLAEEAMARARASRDSYVPTNMLNQKGGSYNPNQVGTNSLSSILKDAFDGGGMGASGGAHKGLGVYSGIANLLGGKN